MMALTDKYKNQPVPLDFTHNGENYKGLAVPIPTSCHEGVCLELDVVLNSENLGLIHYTAERWRMDNVRDQALVNAIGREIFLWYE